MNRMSAGTILDDEEETGISVARAAASRWACRNNKWIKS
jgi:hypothetical protein